MQEIAQIKGELLSYQIKPSIIRIRLYKYLKDNKLHPTAEGIYRELAKEIPTLSLTSIYNNLRLFVAKGLIQEIKIDGTEIRYDGDNKRHAHFSCINCKRILDLTIRCKSCLKLIAKHNHHIIQEQIYFIGICEECLKKQEFVRKRL